MVPEEDPWHTMVPPRFQPRSEAYDGSASHHGYHTETKTHVVWPPGQNGRDSWRQEDSDWCPSDDQSDWSRPVGHPYTSWMATLKSDLSPHNLTFEDAIELALDKSLWRLLVASRATHWRSACQIMMVMMMCQEYLCQKSWKSILLKVTIDNVGVPFLRHSVVGQTVIIQWMQIGVQWVLCAECDPYCTNGCDNEGPGKCKSRCESTHMHDKDSDTCLGLYNSLYSRSTVIANDKWQWKVGAGRNASPST